MQVNNNMHYCLTVTVQINYDIANMKKDFSKVDTLQ